VSELVLLDVVRSVAEAELVCLILRDAGVDCMHRVTNVGSGAMDGITTGGPREIVVRAEELGIARRILSEQQGGPSRPSTGATSERVGRPLTRTSR
jgi:hypothetical protein